MRMCVGGLRTGDWILGSNGVESQVLTIGPWSPVGDDQAFIVELCSEFGDFDEQLFFLSDDVMLAPDQAPRA